jgi:hypothetical protein
MRNKVFYGIWFFGSFMLLWDEWSEINEAKKMFNLIVIKYLEMLSVMEFGGISLIGILFVYDDFRCFSSLTSNH